MTLINKFAIDNSKLLVDASLGKLARWLRFIGYDTTYNSMLDKHSLINLAREKGLILITQSKLIGNIAKNKGVNFMVIQGKTTEEQIRNLKIQKFEIREPQIDLSRCSLCNGQLRLTDTKEDINLVPPGTRESCSQFFKCVKCNHLYWEGSHWNKIKSTVSKININSYA
ncbi:MAG: Mut7-C RNAse domain-containing protein [Candidatus Kariarchaeaceae archaeon]